MTGTFERVALGAAGCLVLGSLTLAIIYPPSSDITVPRAKLKSLETVKASVTTNLPWQSGILPVRVVGKGAESLTEDPVLRTPKFEHKAASLHTAETLSKVFERIGYNLNDVGVGGIAVPRLFLASLPTDLAEMRHTEKRKTLFFRAVLPLVLQANDEIKEERQRLLDLNLRLNAGESLPAVDRLWLIVMAERYKFKRIDMAKLLKRVDVVPVSLALAQAAEESGWGTSRFSREGNAIFGEWTFASRDGLVPRKREIGKSHKVRVFKSLLGSVRAYVHNLNTHRAYRGFRILRNQMRASGTPIRGRQLSKTLTSYSERGAEYIKGLRAIISGNRLERLDNAKLSRSQFPMRPVI